MEEHCFTRRAPLLTKKIAKRADVVSDLNLQGFLAWASRVDEDALNKVWDVVSIREHKCIVDCIVPSPAPSVRGKMMRTKPCNRAECPRCETLRGGYYFQHTSTKWTPRLAVVAPKGFPGCPNLCRFLCKNLRWPLGLLPDGADTELRLEAQAALSEASSEPLPSVASTDKEALTLAFLLGKWNAAASAQGRVASTGRLVGISKSQRLAERMEAYQKEAAAILALVLGVGSPEESEEEHDSGSLSGRCTTTRPPTWSAFWVPGTSSSSTGEKETISFAKAFLTRQRAKRRDLYSALCSCPRKRGFPRWGEVRLARHGKPSGTEKDPR